MSDKTSDSTTSKGTNPYHYYKLEWGAWFYHDSVIKRIREVFENHPDKRIIVLQGETGSGKTRILKQIENSPDILGKNHIPVYLDLTKYTGIHMETLPRALYKDIVEKLKNYDYDTPASGTIEPTLDGSTIEFIFLKIRSTIKPDDILIVIFDEFDQLLKNADKKGISDYIQYIKSINQDWNNFGLIIVGDEILDKSTGSPIIHRFLNSGYKINLDKSLKEENINERIVGRAKNILEYDEAAIKKITWYSGKNLYFEQLICYFIVHLLEEEKRNQCTTEDVDIVVQRILKDQKDEFNKAWEKELPPEMKIIASALADESIIEKKSHLYVLTENNLLEAIFGERLNEKIEEFQRMGYLTRIQGRHFPKFPFKVRIFAMYVKNEHPFLRTFLENFEAIADSIDLNILVEQINQIPDEQLNLFDKEAILLIAKTWTSLKTILLEKKRTPTRPQIQSFLENFTSQIKINAPQWDSNQKHFILDIKKLNIGIFTEAQCLIQGRPELIQEDINHIENAATAITHDAKTRLTLFFYFHESGIIEELVKKTYLILIAISENDLKKIMFSNTPLEAFRKIFLSRLSLKLISPYRTEGPARQTFYGRRDNILQITKDTDTSYSIVGARKIGKTSLLHRIKDYPPPNIAYLFINLELVFNDVIKSYNRFLKVLEGEVYRVFYKKIKFNRFPFLKDVKKLPDVFKKLANIQEKKIAFILDEIDDLIEFDKKHKNKLMKIFRGMSDEKNYQFIFAGFKQLYHSKRHIENPMYNFCEEIIMAPLDQEAALELVTKPMESIGVHYHDKQDRKVILEYTGRHPNLLQFFCKKLIEKIERHHNAEDRRTIFKGDIEEVFDDDFQKYIIDEIYMFFSDLSDINRLILILLVEAPPKKRYFSLSEIKGLLMDCGIRTPMNDVHRNLRELVMRFILLEEGENYRFALPIFPVILKKRVDNEFKNRTIKEIKING